MEGLCDKYLRLSVSKSFQSLINTNREEIKALAYKKRSPSPRALEAKKKYNADLRRSDDSRNKDYAASEKLRQPR